ncbi:hypothetical protein MHK_004899, partial [Candidatus Magnetomorum sp. HK-1]
EDLNVGLKIQEGVIEGMKDDWLRWCDSNGEILLTGKESADVEKKRVETEKKRAEAEKKRADIEKNRADELEKELSRLKRS